MVDTESLVPPGHLLRQVDAAVDFEKLYKIVEPLYSEEEGRRSIDPVVLFKIVLLQHLDGNTSLRGTLRRAQTDIAYRWFLRYTLSEELPHFSTVSYNFRHRFTSETIEAVFRWILEEAGSAGALTPAAVFIDGTHMRYTFYRGLAQVSNWVRLKFAAMNLKKLARWKTRKRCAPSSSATSYILSLINFEACLVMKTDRPLFDRLTAAPNQGRRLLSVRSKAYFLEGDGQRAIAKTVEEYLLSPNKKILFKSLAKHTLALVIRIEGNRKTG